MSSPLNTVEPVALRHLMSETIFDIEAPEARRAPHNVRYLGQNKRRYLFLTHEAEHEWMSEAAMDALVKTLAALQLAVDDVAVLNIAKLAESPSADELSAFFDPKVVVNLGTSLDWPEQAGTTVFHTRRFDDMLADAAKKREFWATIKTLLI